MDRKRNFVTYAHRGASEYCPENTFMSFYMGMQMGANGIETDVQKTKDGIPVLFHDRTLERMCGVDGGIGDYTWEELQRLDVKKGDLCDKIPTLEDFLAHFAHRDITFAMELKGADVEADVADLIFRFHMENKCVVTSFSMDFLKRIKEIAPSLRVGYLTKTIDDSVIGTLLDMGAYEICPDGRMEIDADAVAEWHRMGLNVRAWGIADDEIMKRAYDAGVDGMTVNFPDRLLRYIAETGQDK